MSVVFVFPDRSLQWAPASVLTCHWTVGVGLPLAAAVNDAFEPYVIDWGVGWVVIEGAVQAAFTVNV